MLELLQKHSVRMEDRVVIAKSNRAERVKKETGDENDNEDENTMANTGAIEGNSSSKCLFLQKDCN